MSDLQLETTLTANAGPLNAALQAGAQGVQSFSAQATQAARAQASAATAGAAALDAQRGAMQRARAESGQLAAAYRQLPMQITDVTTSLVSGMPVWMVAIQQGGQIRDSFGGTKEALQGVASVITPVRVGYTLLAAVAGTLLHAHMKGEAEVTAYTRAIVLSGNAAGVTRIQLDAMARSVAGTVGTQAEAAAALAAATSSGRVAAQNLELVATAALNMQRFAGVAVADTVAQFAELGREPVKASAKLNEQFNYLTISVYEQIKALAKRGDMERAAIVAQEALAKAMNSRTAELKANLGTIETLTMTVTTTAKAMWDALLGVGRKPSAATDLATAQIALAQLDNPNRRSQDPRRDEQARTALRERIAALQENIRLEGRAASAQQTRAEETAKHIREEQEREKAVKAAEDAYASARSAIAQRAAALREELAAGTQLTEVQRLELQLRTDIAEAAKKATPAQVAKLQQDAAETAALARKVALQREAADAGRRAVEEARRDGEAALREAQGLEASNEAMRREIETMGLNAAAIAAVERARISSAIAIKEEQLARFDGLQVMSLEEMAIRAQIEALKERDRLLSSRAQRVEDVAYQQGIRRRAEMERDAEEQRRDSIAASISEGVARGTLSAKGLWDTLRQEVAREFARTVLQPTIKPLVAEGFDWVKGLIGAATSYFSGGFGTGNAYGNQDYGQFFHGGGVVGLERPATQRRLPSALWAGAPRFHQGMLAADEYPAVLQKGESVLTPGQMKAVAGAGGPQVVQNVTYNVPPGYSPAAFAAALEQHRKQIKAEVALEMARPGRTLNRAAAGARY